MGTETVDALNMIGIILMLTMVAVPKVFHREIYNHQGKSKFKSDLKTKKNKKETKKMFNKILVPFSNLEDMKQTLPYAVDLATQFQAELILLRIFPPFRADLVPSVASIREVQVITTKLALRHLEEIAEPIRKIGIKVKSLTIEGLFQEEINNFAKINGISLIVLSAHKPRGLFSKLFKRVSDRVHCESDIPVIVVPDNFNKESIIEEDFKSGMPDTGEIELCPYCFSKERFEIDSWRYYGNLDEVGVKNKAIIVHCTNCKKIMGSIRSYA